MRGAEAIVKNIRFVGLNAVRKDRMKKNYRETKLDDNLRTRRTRAEARLLHKAKAAGVPCPTVLSVDNFSIVMTLAKGKRPKMTQKESKVAGAYLSKLHNAGIIHGDYTKANLILTKEGLVVIDFGLGFFSKETEDKAVDVFTMLKSLENGPSRKAFLSGYSSSGNKAVVGQLENIRKRMRYIKA